MAWTSAELRLDEDFVDVCHLLIRRPQVLLPVDATPVTETEWLIVRRMGTHWWRRRVDVLVTVEHVVVLNEERASLTMRWRFVSRRGGGNDGTVIVRIDALPRPPSSCTVVTVAIEPPASRLRNRPTRRRTVNDLAQTQVRDLTEVLSAGLDALANATFVGDLPTPTHGWTNEAKSKKEPQ